MSDYSIVPNAALTATADAIRTKSGSQATIEFDHNTGFKDAVDAIPSGGGGPDLSNDTVTAATLLVGETAHDSSGTAITGTLTGLDLMPGTLVITAVNPTTAISIPRGVLGWNSTGKYLINSTRIFPVGGSVSTFKIPSSYTLIAFPYKASNPLTFSDLSSGVSVFNNGDPIPISSTASVYIVNISGNSSSTRSFTVTGA